jgi:hypothetical protein
MHGVDYRSGITDLTDPRVVALWLFVLLCVFYFFLQ